MPFHAVVFRVVLPCHTIQCRLVSYIFQKSLPLCNVDCRPYWHPPTIWCRHINKLNRWQLFLFTIILYKFLTRLTGFTNFLHNISDRIGPIWIVIQINTIGYYGSSPQILVILFTSWSLPPRNVKDTNCCSTIWTFQSSLLGQCNQSEGDPISKQFFCNFSPCNINLQNFKFPGINQSDFNIFGVHAIFQVFNSNFTWFVLQILINDGFHRFKILEIQFSTIGRVFSKYQVFIFQVSMTSVTPLRIPTK